MNTPKVGTRLQTDIGRRFHVTANTAVLDLGEVQTNRGHTVPALLLCNQNRGVVVLADGSVFEPAAGYAVELVERANVTRKANGQPPLKVPSRLAALARHAPPVLPLPWPAQESQGYRGRVPEQTLHVHRPTGRAVLIVETTPPRTPRQAAKHGRTFEVEKLGVRAAVRWLFDNGIRFIPATLHKLNRLGAADDDAPATDPAPIS